MKHESSTAWADYVDSRRRLIHEWRDQGWTLDDIAHRLTLAEGQLESILEQAVEPPFPGSSRYQLIEWKRRANALEAEVHAAGGVPSEPPKESEFRALAMHPDPELCGCQYWTDHPRPGQHHPGCQHAKAKP